MTKEFTVLSVADRPFDKFTLTWLKEQVEKHKPEILEMSERQAKLFSTGRPEDKPYFRGIYVKIVKHSFFGVKV